MIILTVPRQADDHTQSPDGITLPGLPRAPVPRSTAMLSGQSPGHGDHHNGCRNDSHDEKLFRVVPVRMQIVSDVFPGNLCA
jgi:hypothetical protein